MTFQQIQYILEVYKTGSFSTAAKNLFMAQSNLSNAVRAPEQELGFPIFHRTKKGIIPTEKGTNVLSHAGEIMNSYRAMQTIGKQNVKHKVRIAGLQYTPVCDAFVKLCSEYRDSEQMEFSYQVNIPLEEMLNQVYFSLLDAAVTMFHPQQTEHFLNMCEQKNIRYTKLADIPIVLKIGRNHPLYNQSEVRLSDFANYPFVDYGNRVFSDFPNIGSVLKINYDKVVYCADNHMKNQLISETTMYGLGSKLTASGNQKYHFRSIPMGDMHYCMYVIRRENDMDSEIINRFIEITKEILADL